MNFLELRKRREQQKLAIKSRRPMLTSQEERFLYHLHMKNIEHRTLMLTIKQILTKEQIDDILVEYALRLRKARENFSKNNWKDEWYDEASGGPDH